MSSRIWSPTIALIFAVTCLPALWDFRKVARAEGESGERWTTLITPQQLHERAGDPRLLIIDVRNAEDYAAGHIPQAINLPGSQWRTPATKNPAVEGVGQQVFRDPQGVLDLARYELLLGAAGIRADHAIVVYGNHAGKADGSVPATILLKLGHESVAFLDGVGADRWVSAGYALSKEPRQLAAAKYAAKADARRLWSYDDVVKNLNNQNVVFIDSRTAAEYAGDDLRGNKRGGHIPGAISLDSEQFIDKASQTTISYDSAKAKIEALIPRDKTVVVYCQSGTRCSHEELILKDLGYKNVVLYDASWQEWGNREGAPIEKPEDQSPASK